MTTRAEIEREILHDELLVEELARLLESGLNPAAGTEDMRAALALALDDASMSRTESWKAGRFAGTSLVRQAWYRTASLQLDSHPSSTAGAPSGSDRIYLAASDTAPGGTWWDPHDNCMARQCWAIAARSVDARGQAKLPRQEGHRDARCAFGVAAAWQ